MNKSILPVFLLLLPLTVFAQSFRVVGYLPHYRFHKVDEIDLGRLTHLNIAFGNPDRAGKISLGGKDPQPILSRSKELGVEVLLSLGGGALRPAWAESWRKCLTPQHRGRFIGQLLAYLNEEGFDGVDIDLEWKHVGIYYSDFVLELRDSLDRNDMLLTAAMPGNFRYPELTDEALQAFDYINVMAYDLKGPWSRRSPGDHSPISFARESIDFWKSQGLRADQLVLGLPFYGYHFGKSRVSTFPYSLMIERDTARAFVDRSGNSFYNGIPTIMEKTVIAAQEASGVMIWELGLDSEGAYSLLDAISRSVGSLVREELDEIRFFPNPFIDYLNISSPKVMENGKLFLFDDLGRIIYFQRLQGAQWEIDASGLPNGAYTVVVAREGGSSMRQLIKIGGRRR